LLDSNVWLRTYATWAESEDRVYSNEDAATCAEFSEWFGRAYDELLAVLDMRGVDPLLLLGAREVWPLDELPQCIDADTLRCLDDDGFIEARCVIMNNQSKFPGDPTPPIPSRGEWCSPMRERHKIGDWDAVLMKNRRDTWHHPSEVRVSERGRAQLARLRRGTAAAAKATTPSAIDATGRPAAKRARRPKRARPMADRVRELLSGKDPYEKSKSELAAEVGYTHPASLESVKNFQNLWSENERRLAERRAAAEKRANRARGG